MTIGGEPTPDEALDDVFARDDSHDSEAESVASEPAGQPRDESGRFAAQPAPTPEAPQPEASSPPPQPDTTNRHVPLAELLSERERYKAERKAREDFERKALETETRLRVYEQMLQRPPAQPQYQEPQAPDPMMDPEGAYAYQMAQIQRVQLNSRLDASEFSARSKYGDDLIDAAVEAAIDAGVNMQLVNERNPYEALVRWHKQHVTMQEIGPDPDAYKSSLKEQARQELLAELKAGKIGIDGQPIQPTRFPGSLASATATGKQGAHLTAQTAADSVFARLEP